MISIGKLVDAEQVVRYLIESTADAQLEYYVTRDEAPGRWTGRAAERLGLDGTVTHDQLRSLLNGRDPRSGADLMERRWSRQSVVAYDVTFSAPKSVSLLYAVGDEQTRAAVLRAHQAAVDAVCEYLQAHAGWGRRYDRESEETIPVRAQLALPQFLHRTSRPVTDAATGAVTVDPQLHTHIPIPNYVLRDDGTWGQLHGVALYRHAPSAGAVGQAVLRDALVRELGVPVSVARNGTFEVVGITRAMRQEFSRRTRQVAAMDAAFGVDSLHGHKLAVLASREGKHGVPPGHDVFAEWRQRADTVGLDVQMIAALLGRELSPERTLNIADVRQFVGEHGMTAEAATFTRRDLVRAVAAHAPLGLPLSEIERIVDAVLADRSNVVRLGALNEDAAEHLPSSFREYIEEDRRYSTPEMVAIEERMLATARAGRLAGRGLAPVALVDEAVASRPNLTGEQQTMIHAICRRGEAVTLVNGSAGSGKTTALAACREVLEASGHQVVGAALSANAAFKLGQEAGIETSTVHSLLHRLAGSPMEPNTVLVIDEAAMVGSRQVAQLVDHAARDEAKLVLVGDPRQLHAIDGGAAFRALGDQLGSVRLSENVRQADEWERRALVDLREGRTAEAVAAYLAHDAVTTSKHGEYDLQWQVLRDYRSAVEQGRDAIMLTHRRKDVDALNRRSHAYAAEHGQLEGPAITVGSLHARGDGSFAEPKEFRAGDRAVCLENDHQRGLTNGLRVQVIGVDPEVHAVTLRTPDDRHVTVDVRHYDAIDHGYAMTVHKAQGLSVDVSLVLARGNEGREWTYTAMSRGREANLYYTGSASPLPDERGTHLHEERPDELAERLERQWGRSEARDSTLDYERFDEAVERHSVQRKRELSEVLGMLDGRTPRLVPAKSIDDDPFDHDYTIDCDHAIDHDPFHYAEDLSADIGGPSPF
jgi:conjugative relaxase-like TrwC/TraI family protein